MLPVAPNTPTSTLPPAEPRSDTAGRALVAHVPTAAPDARVSETLAGLRGKHFGSAALVCLIDDERQLLGTVSLQALLTADPDTPLRAVANTDPPRVHVDADQERVAHLALRTGESTIVVVSASNKLLGVVPASSLMRVLYREHEEDLHKLAGIAREDSIALGALEAPPRRRARDRLPWLLVGLVGSALATWVTSRFEATLHAKVAVSFFIPGLVYLADAVGTQTEAIVVRGLAHEEHRVRAGRLLRGEIVTGLLIGAVLAALVFPAVWLAFGDMRLGAAVAISLFIAAVVATTVGMVFPWALHRRGIDPAFGSGPLATVVQDVLSLAVYLVVVRLLL